MNLRQTARAGGILLVLGLACVLTFVPVPPEGSPAGAVLHSAKTTLRLAPHEFVNEAVSYPLAASRPGSVHHPEKYGPQAAADQDARLLLIEERTEALREAILLECRRAR